MFFFRRKRHLFPGRPLFREKITDFEIITLNISAMRFASEYEIVREGSKAVISEYQRIYRDGKENKDLIRQTSCDQIAILELLEKCRVRKWDGFSGANPPGVLDGEMFSFKAKVNDGKDIIADGSNNFPSHYKDFSFALRDMLRNSTNNDY